MLASLDLLNFSFPQSYTFSTEDPVQTAIAAEPPFGRFFGLPIRWAFPHSIVGGVIEFQDIVSGMICSWFGDERAGGDKAELNYPRRLNRSLPYSSRARGQFRNVQLALL